MSRKREARRELGIEDGQLLLITLGSVHWLKGPDACIEALAILRKHGVNAVLHFVGYHQKGDEFQKLADSLGLGGNVKFFDHYVSDEAYRNYIIAADVAIQPRRIYLGALSGALQNCIAAGLPTVANESLAESLDAPSYVRRVPDSLSPDLVAAAVGDLLDGRFARSRLEAERQAYCAAHDFADYARYLCQALELEIPE